MKKLILGLMMAFAVAVAFAKPHVIINNVESASPWDGKKGTITVDYSLDVGLADTYKVAFDITADGRTAGVTNDVATLTEGLQTPKKIDTVALFGREVVDPKAKVKVSLIEVVLPAGVQLWTDGPFWVERNIGGTLPGDYGGLYTFDGDKAKDAAEGLGDGWRLPTKAELEALISNCTKNWETCKDSNGADIAGYRFTSTADSSKSIFLPAAGGDSGQGRTGAGNVGGYWSAEESVNPYVWYLGFFNTSAAVAAENPSTGMSVRAVHGPEAKGSRTDFAEAEFPLGPDAEGSKGNPWKVGATGHEDEVTAYTNGVGGLIIEGTGAVASTPWVPFADGIAKLVKAEDVTGLKGIMMTLPDLTNVNGLTLDELASAGMLGAVKAGFSTIAVEGGKACLGVSVCTNGDVTAATEDWEPAAIEEAQVEEDGTVTLTVPATAEQGFMLLKSKPTGK